MSSRVLCIGADGGASSGLKPRLETAGYVSIHESDTAEALRAVEAEPAIAAIVLDTVLADADALQTLKSLVAMGQGAPIIVTVRADNEEAAADFLQAGAADYCTADAGPFRLKTSIDRALDRAHPAEPAAPPPFHFSSDHPELAKCRERAQAMARHAIPVLIEGGPGTGKKRLADWIARQSRTGGKVQTLCCRAGEVTVAELADAIRQAAGGTLIIGEVGNLPPDAQRLLAQRINGSARIIATSRTRLVDLAAAGQCDSTLFASLNVATIHLPALADTPGLIADLAPDLVRHFGRQMGRTGMGLAPGCLEILEALPFTDNRRELAGLLARAVALSPEPDIATHFLAELAGRHPAPVRPNSTGHEVSGTQPLAEVEREAITRALAAASGRIGTAAELLGMGRSTLYRKIGSYGLQDTSKAA